MKLQSLILLLFLLIPCTAISQDGLTTGKHFWFTETQVREIYKVKLELELLQSENVNLGDIIRFCDSVNMHNIEAKVELKKQLDIRTQQYNNSKLINEQERGKFAIAEETLQSINRRKNLYITTTAVAVTLTLLVLILK